MSDYERQLRAWEKRRVAMQKLARSGDSNAEIGRRMGGISRQRVSKLLKRNGK